MDDISEQSLKEHHSDDERMENLCTQSSIQSEYCCGMKGICSHEVLRDGEADSDPNVLPNKFMRKVILYYIFSVHLSCISFIQLQCLSYCIYLILTFCNASHQMWDSNPQTLVY